MNQDDWQDAIDLDQAGECNRCSCEYIWYEATKKGLDIRFTNEPVFTDGVRVSTIDPETEEEIFRAWFMELSEECSCFGGICHEQLRLLEEMEAEYDC